MVHSDCGWTCGCAGKTVRSLENTCYTWALLRWAFVAFLVTYGIINMMMMIHYEVALYRVYAPLPAAAHMHVNMRGQVTSRLWNSE